MYKIVMATRLKRKVFLSRNIIDDVLSLSRGAVEESGYKIIKYEFLPYGMELVVDCKDEKETAGIIRAIRRATSGTVRKRYPELWSMPSFWTRKCLVVKWPEAGTQKNATIEFYKSLKSR